MIRAYISVVIQGEECETIDYSCLLSSWQAAAIRNDTLGPGEAKKLLYGSMAECGLGDALAMNVREWTISLQPQQAPTPTGYFSLRGIDDADLRLDPVPRSVARCRSILRLAKLLLPPGDRGDALDEWVDEIECVAADGRPVFRRTVSILLRSLPALIWRSRFAVRVRRGGS